MAETLASFSSATVGTPSTAALRGGGNGYVLVRLGRDVSTLLGPERTTVVLLFQNRCEVVDLARLPGMAWPHIPLAVAGFGVGRIGLWVGRLLRIAQWTRASLWSSCQGRTVNALAPGADEGRGRPR